MSVTTACVLGLALITGQTADPRKPETEEQLRVGPGTKPFDVTRRLVDLREIALGGPPRDGIPALIEPRFVSAAEAGSFMRDNDEVIGVVENAKAKAYPIKILTYHEVVNDQVGGRPVAVTY
jgi:hypothetical protein